MLQRNTRIYTSENLPTYDREGSLEKSVKKFCQTEVHPMDQARYLEFLDFASIPRRIEASAKRFIQGFFRMRWGNDTTNWDIARVTQIPTSVEKAYLLTIQALQGRDLRWLDKIAGEHPDALE